ncbi:MAG: lysophospholipid acyltransferase family protein [Xanthomonadales bacterium]|nr:lysophospholipid acyltransferase family protein [Xanthomonadales bacterium]
MSIEEQREVGPRWWRYVYRVPLLAGHLLITLPITLLAINPLGQRVPVGNESLTEAMIRFWSRLLCRIFGIRVRCVGTLRPGPVMLLANHISWIDIEVIHSLRAASFVAKAEIARWPVVGWLARAGGTVFHDRGSDASRHAVTEALAEKLRGGHSVAIFPEGRTGDGARVLPFHGRMLKAAIDTETPVQPIALAFLRDGRLCNTEVAFRDGEHFLGNLWRLLGEAPIDVEVVCAPPRPSADGQRRDLARGAHDVVVQALEARQ